MLTNVKEITFVPRTLIAQTELDHTYVNATLDILEMYVNATLDILEMDVIVQVNSIDFLIS